MCRHLALLFVALLSSLRPPQLLAEESLSIVEQQIAELGKHWTVVGDDYRAFLAQKAGAPLPATARDLRKFESLRFQMSAAEVYLTVGAPDILSGSGIAYDIYVLNDGGQVSIAWASGDALAWAVHYTTEGEKRILIRGPSKQ